jgi:hypothetical protein
MSIGIYSVAVSEQSNFENSYCSITRFIRSVIVNGPSEAELYDVAENFTSPTFWECSHFPFSFRFEWGIHFLLSIVSCPKMKRYIVYFLQIFFRDFGRSRIWNNKLVANR